MATTTQISAPPPTTSPIALWHLLSLDAPSVAALWTWFVARANHLHLPAASILAMGLAVWILYAADRLLDARILDSDQANLIDLEARHFFHHRHRPVFISGIVVLALALACLLPSINLVALHIYLLESILLIGWFLLVHSTHARLPKEPVVGLFFAAATFTPTISRRVAHPLALLASALLFAAVCTLNCLFIHTWEREPHMARFLAPLSLLVASVSVGIALFDRQPLAGASALAALLLFALHHNRFRLSRIHLRAAADLALLTPALFLPFLRWL